MNKIIAVIGMCGSGKSEAVKYIVEKGYSKVYFGDVVLNRISDLHLTINEENERKVREDLRREYGEGAMAIKSIDKIREYYRTNNVVIESLYSWEEYKIIHNEFKKSFKLLAVYTTKNIRYDRLKKRIFRPLTNELAESRDISELENLNKGGPIAFADWTIINDDSLDELKKQIDKIIET